MMTIFMFTYFISKYCNRTNHISLALFSFKKYKDDQELFEHPCLCNCVHYLVHSILFYTGVLYPPHITFTITHIQI